MSPAGTRPRAMVHTAVALACLSLPAMTTRAAAVVTDAPGPVAPPVLTSPAAGAQHTCVIREAAVWCSGSNASGQLGNGTTTRAIAFAPSLMRNAVSIDASASTTCAVATDASAWCWGAVPTSVTAVDGSVAVEWVTSPSPVRMTLTEVRSIAVGTRHACALRTDSSVWVLGRQLAWSTRRRNHDVERNSGPSPTREREDNRCRFVPHVRRGGEVECVVLGIQRLPPVGTAAGWTHHRPRARGGREGARNRCRWRVHLRHHHVAHRDVLGPQQLRPSRAALRTVADVTTVGRDSQRGRPLRRLRVRLRHHLLGGTAVLGPQPGRSTRRWLVPLSVRSASARSTAGRRNDRDDRNGVVACVRHHVGPRRTLVLG